MKLLRYHGTRRSGTRMEMLHSRDGDMTPIIQAEGAAGGAPGTE